MLQFDYFSGDSPVHLTAIGSRKLLIAYCACLWLMGLSLILFWPKQAISNYLKVQAGPFCFTGCVMAALVILSYLNLRCGRGELALESDPERRCKQRFREQTQSFLGYGLVQFVIHNLLLVALLLPFFLTAAAISGISPTIFMDHLVLIFITALFYRLLGFSILLFLGRWNSFAFIFSRAIYIGLFFLTVKFAPWLNPLHLLFINATDATPATSLNTPHFMPFYLLVFGGSTLLVILCTISIRFSAGFSAEPSPERARRP